ncbi:MAG TPA: prepilin-type N-terminal cleavage/methylation domain-containing protein [Longimicrobiales bacterium]
MSDAAMNEPTAYYEDAMVSGRREGFSLVEVVVTMVILAVIVMSLAALTGYTAQQSLRAANATGRQAVALQEANRVAALPYTALPATASGCSNVTIGLLTYQRCYTVTTGTRFRDVMVVITPQRAGTFADTVRIRRVINATPNPLNTP